jgi:hypothetical protein
MKRCFKRPGRPPKAATPCTIETNRLVVIHGKADGGGIGGQLGIGDPGKRLNDDDIEGGQIQDRLLHRYPADQRHKLDTELPDGPSEFVDIGEMKRLQDRRRCE